MALPLKQSSKPVTTGAELKCGPTSGPCHTGPCAGEVMLGRQIGEDTNGGETIGNQGV